MRITVKKRLLVAVLAGMVAAVLVAPAAGAGEGRQLPLAAALCINKAQAQAEEGQIQEAVKTLETFIAESEKGNHPYLYFTLGNYLAMLSMDKGVAGAGKKAIFSYKKAVDADPGFSEAWLNLARCCYEAEDFKGAAHGFEKGYDHSESPQAIHLYFAAICRFQCDEAEGALVLFDTLLKKHPDAVTLAWKEVLVNILFSLDRYKQALPYIEELAEKTQPPNRKKWQEILLQQYLNLDMDKEALALALSLTRTDPLESKWWKALAHIRLKSGNGEKDQAKALADLLVYGYLTPMSPEEKQLAGDLYLTLDIPEKAAGVYADILSGRFSFSILEKQAQALVMSHMPDEALSLINRALSEHGSKGTPGKNMIRLKKDLEQIMAYREDLRAYTALKSQTGRPLSQLPDDTKEIQ